jgi:dienelactone hydrolase
LGAMLAFVDRQAAAKPGPVGAHGYCMSGPYALAAAARYPDRVTAAASFYGTWLVSDAEESPHLNLGKAKGELYIACAEHDELAPLPMSRNCVAHSRAPAPRARSNFILVSTTGSPSRNGGVTTSPPRNVIGSGL